MVGSLGTKIGLLQTPLAGNSLNMRKRWAERYVEQDALHGKGPQANACLQIVATSINDRAKRKVCDDDHEKHTKTRVSEVASTSRKRLREELQEQAKVSRQRLCKHDCLLEQPKQKPKYRIKGNDAITRLLNIGRHHQGDHHDETKGTVESDDRLLNAGACSPRATEGVVASSL